MYFFYLFIYEFTCLLACLLAYLLTYLLLVNLLRGHAQDVQFLQVSPLQLSLIGTNFQRIALQLRGNPCRAC